MEPLQLELTTEIAATIWMANACRGCTNDIVEEPNDDLEAGVLLQAEDFKVASVDGGDELIWLILFAWRNLAVNGSEDWNLLPESL